jgi:hypothetical protein
MKYQKSITLLNVIFMIALILSVAVKYNDPDPLLWMLVYGAGGGCCILFMLNKLHWALSAIVFTVTVFSAGMFLPDVLEAHVSIVELFQDITMKSKGVEYGREMGGLLIEAIWMGVLTVVMLRGGGLRAV